jgi:hypothetical protein
MTAGKVKSIEMTQRDLESSSPSRAFARQPDVGPSAAGFDPISVPQMGGNLAVQRLLRSGAIQAQLSVSQPSDPYEQEADRVVQQVMSMPTPPSAATVQASVQRQTPEEDEVAQTKPLAATITPLVQRAPSEPLGSFEPGADFEARLGASGGGSPLPARERAFMEPRCGADFNGVRLHTGSEAAQLNRAIRAQAFTYGSHIYLGEGRSDIESTTGKQLLAHELTHTIQQVAVGGNMDRAASQSVARLPVVQRQPAPAPPPVTAPLPAPAPPGVTPPAPVPPDQAAPGGGWSLRGILDGSQKVRFGVGSHTLYSKHAGRRFGWSTERVPGEGLAVPLALGVIPLPLPVGPIELEVNAGVSAFAGGNALLNLKVNDVVLEATAANLARVGAAAFLTLIPVGGPILPLALLAPLRLRGQGTLSATANASLAAGAEGFIRGLVNPVVWPVAGFVEGSLGVGGTIIVEAFFDGPVQVEYYLGRLRVVGSSFRRGTRLAAGLTLNAALSAGVVVGIRPLAKKWVLWPVFVPFWSRTRQFGTAMGVDHVVEWQVWPTAAVDEPWNFELLDPSSNSSAGSGLDANIDRLRAALPAEWQTRTLVFTPWSPLARGVWARHGATMISLKVPISTSTKRVASALGLAARPGRDVAVKRKSQRKRGQKKNRGQTMISVICDAHRWRYEVETRRCLGAHG